MAVIKNPTQSLRRGTKVHITVTEKTPYNIVGVKDNAVIGTTLEDGLGVYLHNVNFKVLDGQPTIEGRFKGFVEQLRLNISEGTGIMFDKEKGLFTDGQSVVHTARMVQVYDGIIKVVIET